MNTLEKSARACLLVGIPICLGFIGVTFGRQLEVKFDPKNFEVLGISVGKSTGEDVDHMLGPSPEREAGRSEKTVRCYVSIGQDRTVLEFENWIDDLIEFRFFQESSPTTRWCTPTSRISNSLSTGSGLKLGMRRTQVITLLGRPTEIHKDRLVYESSYLRPLTTGETKRAKELFFPASRPNAMEVYEKIELRFLGSKVTRVDVTRSERW